MMRPRRAFIIPRSTPFDKRNTDPRLVFMMSSHSSGFIRNKQVVACNSCIVHKDRRRAFLRIDIFQQGVDGRRIGYVQHRAAAFQSRLGEPLAHTLRACVRCRGSDDGSALLRKLLRDRTTDAARSAGHERDVLGEKHAHA